MSLNGILVLFNPEEGEDGIVRIPVVNFPVLPIDSEVRICIPDFLDVDGGLRIAQYLASNSVFGNEVHLDWNESGTAKDAWESLWRCCEEYDSISRNYPHVIDFGSIRRT